MPQDFQPLSAALGILLQEISFSAWISSPGSRNAPLLHAFSSLKCPNAIILDERSAGYFALGTSIRSGKPVILVCTSGTAALNYAPAVAEAFYQRVPLLVITADRPKNLIDNGHGQSIRQENIYKGHLRASSLLNPEKSIQYNIDKIRNSLSFLKDGPVHINVPIKEPLYEASVSLNISSFERISRVKVVNKEFLKIPDWILKAKNPVLIVGQWNPEWGKIDDIVVNFRFKGWLVVAEHLSQLSNLNAISLDDVLMDNTQIPFDAGISLTGSSNEVYCSSYVPVGFNLLNTGSNDLNEALIDVYLDNSLVLQHSWVGSLSAGNSITVSLPSSIYVSDSGFHEIILNVSEINNQPDTNIANNSTSLSFSSYPNTSLISIILELDCWGSETSWEIADDLTGNILWSVPENTYGDSNNGELINETVCLTDGCYDFNIYDSYGDGMFGSQYNSCNVNGNYYLTDQWNINSYLTMSAVNADFGSSATHPFCVQNTGILSDVPNEIKLYPNPTNNFLNINFNSSPKVEFNGEILDLNGKIVHQFQLQSTHNLVDVSLLRQGYYLIKVNDKDRLSNVFSFIKK